MKHSLEIAQNLMLDPAEIGQRELERLLGRLVGNRIDYADIFFEYSKNESWRLEDGEIKAGGFSIDQGVGLRAVSGEKTGFAFSDELTFPALAEAAQSARGIAYGSGVSQKSLPHGKVAKVPSMYQSEDPLGSLSESDKIALLQKVDSEARRQDSRVKDVIVELSGEQRIVYVFRNDGHIVADVQPLVRLNVTVIAEENGRREQARSGGGARTTYDFLVDEDRALEFAREAVRQVIVSLNSVETPAGTMVVVLGPGWPGVLLHEAVGHGLEGDFNRKGASVFSGRIGEQVASELCTIVDDATIPDRRGSLSVDDEGTQAQRTVLIENGVLKGYMQDVTNARLMGHTPTGNGRRESYAHLPMPRMTNTYMLPGDSEHEEIISSVDKGLYASQFSGGQVDITSGKFVFSASEAYMIENGRLTKPLKGATLTGMGAEVIGKITMVGNNLELDSGVGVCGKAGQLVPVGVGQPTLRVDGLTVGGEVV